MAVTRWNWRPASVERFVKRMLAGCTAFLIFHIGTAVAQEGRTVDLTLDTAVQMAIDDSYRIRQLEMSVERTRNWLRSYRAALRSNFSLRLTAPKWEAISDHKWNSTLRKNEIVQENTQTWETDLSIRQPVILFGHPTNGYLSLNNRTYRYAQMNGDDDVRFYNRYFLRFEQPLFQPNELKLDIEEAELDLEGAELSFQDDVVDIADDLADDYYELFESAYEAEIYSQHVNHLEAALEIAMELVAEDSARALELSQIRVELANAREQIKEAQSNLRLESAQLKRRLDLSQEDSLAVDPTIVIRPIIVDKTQAVDYGMTLRPRIQQLMNRKRDDEIDLTNAKGWNSFRANLELTYGREGNNPRFFDMWSEPTNSWSVGLSAYIPLWDWGRRRYRIQAEEISLQKTELYIEEATKEIEADIEQDIRSLSEYQSRAMDMQDNLRMANESSLESIRLYHRGQVSALELIQSFGRERETARNLLATYLGYRRAVLSLQENTFYDFENNVPLLQRFGIGT